jgi:triosephosphate isomerase
MRKPFIAGNWKMNMSLKETVSFIDKLNELVSVSDNKDVLICPPFTALSEAANLLADTGIKLGAQNMHYEEKGAFTGEISPFMVKEICDYVLIGHSERRHVFNEDNELINKKMKAALKYGLIPILCVGEQLQDRKDGLTEDVVKDQLTEGLKDVELGNVIIAYEPVWAIGTGETASPKQAQDVHKFIRKTIKEEYSEEEADSLIVLYGGSVKPENVKKLMAEKDIDGVLVGGASLDAEKFSKIINYNK